MLSHFSFAQLFATSGLSPPGSSDHGILQVRITGVGHHAFLQGLFLTQELKPCLLYLLHQKVGSLPLAPSGKPDISGFSRSFQRGLGGPNPGAFNIVTKG